MHDNTCFCDKYYQTQYNKKCRLCLLHYKLIEKKFQKELDDLMRICDEQYPDKKSLKRSRISGSK
jgi:hypothetical protein